MAACHPKPPIPRLCAEDRRRQIIEAATWLFARQGYQGTTTRQIAEALQVNEAILFRHFPTKEELYWAVIDQKCKEGETRRKMAKHLSAGLPPRETFTSIARDFFLHTRQDSTLGRLLLFSALEHHQLSKRFFHTHTAEKYELLAQYIGKQIEAGTFRRVDPLLAARSFWGMVIYHFMVQDLFGAREYQDIDIDEASRTLAGIWFDGMLPRVSTARRKSAAAAHRNK
jgi:AcrR family transcriptional regulator